MKEYTKPLVSILGLSADERFADVCDKKFVREITLDGEVQDPSFEPDMPPYVPGLGVKQHLVVCVWRTNPAS